METTKKALKVGDQIVAWVKGYRRHVTVIEVTPTHILVEYRSHSSDRYHHAKLRRDSAVEPIRLLP